LTLMVSQNAKRLDKIVDDILNVSRAQPQDHPHTTLDLNESVQRICTDWAGQNGSQRQMSIHLLDPETSVRFDDDHLRRVLVNLLDNARRYASGKADSIQVSSLLIDSQHAGISVWSDGAAMEQSVERHLFEPFFSSESRSSGLGLYICRELCEGHGATLAYLRTSRRAGDQPVDGNEFVITFLRTNAQGNPALAATTATPWQTTLY
jgi:two-component system sensor histidine kinase PilS (NtrC family)